MPIKKIKDGFKWTGSKNVHKTSAEALFEARGHYIKHPKQLDSKKSKKKSKSKGTRSVLRKFG